MTIKQRITVSLVAAVLVLMAYPLFSGPAMDNTGILILNEEIFGKITIYDEDEDLGGEDDEFGEE